MKSLKTLCMLRRVLRLSLVVMALFVSLTVSAQQHTYVSVHLDSRTIQEFIGTIESQTDYRFLYNGELVDVKQRISVDAENLSVEEILNRAFASTDIDYQIKGNQIVLNSKEQNKQSAKSVSGVVRDEFGEPMPGVSVTLTGTLVGTLTSIDGTYEVTLPADVVNPTLAYSFLGYKSVSERVGARSVIDVVLAEDTQAIDDVVVIGYGTQKKVHLSGAVSSVNLEEVGEKRAVTDLSASLQGVSAGLLAQQTSGEPGADAATISIRGLGTLNNTAPLVVIDGVVGSMTDVNPNDVASISVLKDAASSAIYGSRAANGVILITTKTGSNEKIRITYNGRAGIQQVAMPIDVVDDYVLYMETINKATLNAHNTPPFPVEMIQEWRENTAKDPIVYPNTDWFSAVFKNGVIHEHNIQASGGSEKARYLLSFGYLSNGGTMRKSDYDKYSFRSNVDADITRWLRVTANINGYHGVQQGVDVATTMTQLGNSSPGTLPQHPDGRFGGEWATGGNVQAGNIYAALSSYDLTKYTTRLNGKLGLEIKFHENVKWVNSVAISSTFGYSNQMNYPDINLWDFKNNAVLITTGTTSVQLTENHSRAYSLMLDSFLSWDILHKNDDHNLSLLVGYNQEYNQSRNTYAQALDVLGKDTPVMNAATTPSKMTGGYTDNAVQSFFGRINYDFRGKYLFDASVRADGSSRFAKGNRWGVFPTFSAAWRISEEGFLDNADRLDNLKLRASWGQLGNNAVGDYATQLLYTARSYVFGDNPVTGAGIGAVVNEDLTWETTTMINVGVDVVALRNRLSATVDLFDKVTDDILIRTTIPGVLGDLSAPYRNAGKVRNRGTEVELSWNDTKGDFSYGISANYTYVKNRVLKYQGNVASYSGQRILLEGHGIWDFYVREVDEIATQERIDEMLADGYIFYPSTPQPGDFIYKDQQKEGEQGYKIIDDNDRVIKGSSYPKHFFGLSLSLDWKGIDFSALFSGVAGVSSYLNNTWYTNVIRNGSVINRKFLDAWSPENRDSEIPALTTNDGGRNTVANDFWLQNASYLKLRNLTVGYTLPERWTSKFHVSRLRLYFTGENLLTITPFEGLDPENGSTSNYPNMRRYMFGLSVTFK